MPVSVVPASPANLKVTRAEDVPVADALLRARHGSQPTAGPVRAGIGYDAHRFASGRRLVLGGVEIAHDRGLDGHSDADVLLHAIADAVLGAPRWATSASISRPPTSVSATLTASIYCVRPSTWRGRQAGLPGMSTPPSSPKRRAWRRMPLMRERIAACLGLSPGAVGVKATTNEGMGSIGRGEGIAALATATLIPAL